MCNGWFLGVRLVMELLSTISRQRRTEFKSRSLIKSFIKVGKKLGSNEKHKKYLEHTKLFL